MSQPEVVSIGGIDYDKQTGLQITQPVASAADPASKRPEPLHAKGIHASQQRSATLNRQFVQKTNKAPNTPRVAPKSMDVRPATKRSPQITKFATTPQPVTPQPVVSDIAPTAHPIVAKIAAAKQAEQTPAPTSQDIKHAAIGKALHNAQANPTPVKTKKHSRSRSLSVIGASLGVLVIAGYFTYVNLPNLSVRVAASQAGIEASFPEYRPVGYHLNGPIAYQDGEVSMAFTSNSGPLEFSLDQSRSSWDSSALLEKYVNPHSGGKYATYNDGGLTIYTYGTNAAWVNGGILYTLEGTANLSNEQIRHIATSM